MSFITGKLPLSSAGILSLLSLVIIMFHLLYYEVLERKQKKKSIVSLIALNNSLILVVVSLCPQAKQYFPLCENTPNIMDKRKKYLSKMV